MPDTRTFQVSDLNYILDIDLKCFEEPWSIATWSQVCADSNTYKHVILDENTPVGFIVWVADNGKATVIRFAVKRKFQFQGKGKQLLQLAQRHVKEKKLGVLRVAVPESLCDPKSKYEVATWLHKRGGRAALNKNKDADQDTVVFTFSRGVI